MEIEAEVIALLNDLKDHYVDLVTIGQYLQPSKAHAPIHRFVSLKNLSIISVMAIFRFKNIWSAPMVRSSYFADQQYLGKPVPQPFSRKQLP